ncbi:retrovirus-related pol polyprotein from transposon TNT 1-94 [Tanacetum coccineum]
MIITKNKRLTKEGETHSKKVKGKEAKKSGNDVPSLAKVSKKMKMKFSKAWMSFLALPLPINVYKELLNSCLKSPLLPAYLAASFAKKLSRLALTVPPSGGLVIITLVHQGVLCGKLIPCDTISAPRCVVMLFIHEPWSGLTTEVAVKDFSSGSYATIFIEEIRWRVKQSDNNNKSSKEIDTKKARTLQKNNQNRSPSLIRSVLADKTREFANKVSRFVELMENLNLHFVVVVTSLAKCRVIFSEHDSEITKDGKVIGRGIRKKGLYVMKLGNKPKDQICLATIDDNSTLWYRRLGYANRRLIQSLASKELVRNLPKLKFDQHFCNAYKIGKQDHASHKAKNVVSMTKCLELLHIDLFGPSIVQSYRGNRYTLGIVYDYSREFDNEVQFGEFCNANGITYNFSAPRTSQSNGVVERKNRTLQEMSRTMLNEQSLPQKFWCNAVDTSTYILNRILIRTILGKTPYEILRGRKPTLDYFRVFGSKCFILNTKDYLTKFDPKSYEGVFLGYSQNSKAYIILNKHTRKIEESLNVTFDETPPPSKTSPLVDDDLDEEEAIREIEKKNLENVVEDETLEIDEIVNIKESRNHPLENVIGNLNQRTLRSQAQNQSNFYCFISTIEPKNVNEALGDESWIVAMQEELNQFIANDVWELVPQPKNMTIIGTKWVFRNKLDENGVVSRNKARLVAQGYNQQEGIDYDETYAPVARLESIRILLAYACALDFKLFQMDVKSAFLNGFINEEVYVAQPPGFIDFEKPDHVYKLKKALYGLKQAPKAWYDRLKAFLIKHEYKMGMVDNTLFTKKKSSNLIIVQIYVDDIIFGSTCQDMCDEFAKIMHDEFEMSMMGELNFFLGLQIKQMEDGIFFNQSKYIKEMLKKFGLEDSKPMKTPMSSDTKLTKDEECESVDSTKYRGMIDRGKKRHHESNASSSTTLNHPSSSLLLDHVVDENDDESFHSNSSSPSLQLSSSSNVASRVCQNSSHESHDLNTLLSETITFQTQQRDAHRDGLRSIGQALKNMMGGKRK